MAFDGMSQDTDEELLALYAMGDQAAARALTERLTPRVLTLATSMLRDASEAEDVAQEAMLRLWRVAPDWRSGEAKPSTWLHRITTNLCIDRLRRKGRRTAPLEAAPEPIDPTPGATTRLIAAEKAAAVRRAIDALPERQRKAVMLRHFEDLGNPEIAEALDVSVEAVESLLARGRKTLARALASGASEDKKAERTTR